jgi:hypothetical protein
LPTGLGSLRNIAECEESLGQFSSARRTWLDLKQAVLTSTDKKYEGWNNDAEQAVGRLVPKLASLTIDVKVTGTHGETDLPPDGVEVTVNGDALAAPLFGTAFEHDPGSFAIRAAGAQVVEPQEKLVQLNPSEAQRIELDVMVTTPAPSPPIAPPAPVSGSLDNPPPPPPRNEKTRKLLGWTAVGVGAAGIVGAAITLGMRQSALSSIHSICGTDDNSCSMAHQNDVQGAESRGKTTSTLFSVFGLVGIVGLAGGVVLLETVPSSRGARTSLVLSPGALDLRGKF